MKSFISAAVVVGLTALCAVGVSASATAVTPEVDQANATIKLSTPAPFRATNCVGEDGNSYLTLRGNWSGSATDVTAGSTDYSLSGALAVKSIVWEINTQTQRGYLTGGVVLTSPTGGGKTYSGKFTLVTQGVPAPGAQVGARGWIAATFVPPDEGAAPPTDDNIYANVEFNISGTYAATGSFGDAAGSLGVPDFSVVTNVPGDGVC